MVNRTVLISGAGIGGPALAFWLRRHGFAPTVVEVAAAPRPGSDRVTPSAFRVASTFVAVARATPHSRVMPRADGTGSPGRSWRSVIRARISSAIRRYGG